MSEAGVEPQPHAALDPEPGEVVDALHRVLASPDFQRAARSRDFLAYVVTESLAGRGEQLSERTVGRRALERGPDFDGRTSAAVRVRANRVRSALAAYYAGPGAADPVRIAMRPGAYAATFRRATSTEMVAAGEPTTGAELRPGVVVLAFEASGGELLTALADSLSESIVHRLATQPAVAVVGPTRPRTGAADELARWGVATALAGKLTDEDDRVLFRARLLSVRTGEVVWSQERTVERAELPGTELADAWAREIAAQVGDPSGMVLRHEVHRRPEATEPELAARLAFFRYLDRASAESIAEATARVDTALVEVGRTPDLLGMRAALATSASTYGMADGDGLELAAGLAREALALDGTHVHAHLVLGAVARERGQYDLALSHARTACRLAPYHPSYLVGAGITISGCGEWDEGAAVIRDAFRLHPGLPGNARAWLALGLLVRGDHAGALAEASLLPTEGGYLWGPLYRAMALAGLGHLDQAHEELGRAERIRPDVVADPAAYFGGRMRVSDEELARLVALVRAAQG